MWLQTCTCTWANLSPTIMLRRTLPVSTTRNGPQTFCCTMLRIFCSFCNFRVFMGIHFCVFCLWDFSLSPSIAAIGGNGNCWFDWPSLKTGQTLFIRCSNCLPCSAWLLQFSPALYFYFISLTVIVVSYFVDQDVTCKTINVEKSPPSCGITQVRCQLLFYVIVVSFYSSEISESMYI